MISKNIVQHHYKITQEGRKSLLNQNPVILWFTGLSGSGKSTLADRVEQELFSKGFKTYLLDGDNIRHGLNQNVDFSAEGRKENIRRIGEVAKLFTDAGIITLTAFVSPFREDRLLVRNLVKKGEFIEIFVSCPLKICETRDVKGLYKKARAGEIPDFTGITSPFEEPVNAEITVQTDKMDIEECVELILQKILPAVTY
jgi:adenylylsulfate kinase